MISYDGLWDVMKRKGVTQYTLIKKYGVLLDFFNI